jgi:hypothetical protein
LQEALELAAALAIIVTSIAVALAGLYVVRVRFDVSALQGNHEVGGIFFAVLGTAYGVMLSIFVAAAWDRYQAAGQTGYVEAADIGSIYWLSSQLPDSIRQSMLTDLRNYTQTVINVEWPLMARNQESNQAWNASDQLWQTVLAFQPNTEHEQTIYSSLLSARQQLDHDRRLRLLSAQDQIPDSLWIVLDIGAIMTIFFTYHFGMRRFTPQAIMTGALTGLITLVLLLVYQLDNPYQGFAKIQPSGFYSVANLINSSPPQ